jgi:hypothetical protein
MTLTLKIRNTNSATYAAAVHRHGSVVLRLQPGEEGEVSLWDDAPLDIVEEPAAAAPNTEAERT